MPSEPAENPVKYQNYATFWPFYLAQHAHSRTRMLHITGTFLALLALAKAILSLDPLWLILVPVFGYGFAWAAHFFVEKNHPATFSHPFWSLRGDLHMFLLWATGRLETELAKHHITD